MEDLVVQNVSAVTHMIDEHEKGDTDSEIDCLPESFDITPLAASRNQRKLLCEGGGEKRRRRGRPRKLQQSPASLEPKRARGRPKKCMGNLEGTRLTAAVESWHMVPADVWSEEGIQTRARRAFIRSQQVGMLFNCSEEVAVRELAKQIKARR